MFELMNMHLSAHPLRILWLAAIAPGGAESVVILSTRGESRHIEGGTKDAARPCRSERGDAMVRAVWQLNNKDVGQVLWPSGHCECRPCCLERFLTCAGFRPRRFRDSG